MWLALALAAALMTSDGTRAGQVAAPPPAVIADPPPDAAHPARMDYVRIPSHGALMNGVVYVAAGPGPHPTVLLLHGFPGNEQNLDLAQAIRRAGYNVLTLHYRGAWGSPGVFSFAHAIEDSDAAVAFLRDPANQAKFAIDEARVFVAGHSMGGFMAASAFAHDPKLFGLIMISAWDIGASGSLFRDPNKRLNAANEFSEDAIPLAGTSAEALMDEAATHAAEWDFAGWAGKIGMRPVLIITSDDGTYGDCHRLAQNLFAAGDGLTIEVHMAADHPYSDHRIALESEVVSWLQGGMLAPVESGMGR
jgi:pimeloyl-ACP methyl ester carboxylesterase